MKIESIALIAGPVALLVLIIWYAAKSDKKEPESAADPEEEMLFDPLTGKYITIEEAEQGMNISEEEEEVLLKEVEFEDVEPEQEKEEKPNPESEESPNVQ